MASDPVIIDDGGSTRIRHLPVTGVGNLDSLLNVHVLPEGSPAPGMQGSQHTFTQVFADLTIVFIDPTSATPTAIKVAGCEKGDPPPLSPRDKIVVVSGGFTVQIDIDPGGTGVSVMTSFASETSCAPLVGAQQQNLVIGSQQNQRRRYLIGAAPPIDKVTVTLKGVTSTAFDASMMPSSYTQIHLK